MGTQQKLTNARNNAEAQVKKGLSQAEKLAKDNGINIDFNKIFDDLNAKYGKQVEAAVQNAANQAKVTYNNNRKKANNIQANANVQKAQNLAKTANFQKLLNQATKAVNAQISKVGNKEVQKNLK